MQRRELRENIFKLLFITQFHDREELKEQIDLYFEDMENIKNEDRKYISEKVTAVTGMLDDIDKVIAGVSEGWKLDRITGTDLSILRLAYFEMKHDDTIPVNVAINEAVEIAKKYGTDDSPSFVNGILAKLV
ncbi:transcription antitermination factor NusB [Parasporobacterium paucivorans]|uniref:Transcription antitermination protein NusB n=1 Tax=Parasporobacterium paucivorans DSM 15970 TaxID=1122934 RepID=A0A1M6FBD0_9FIRM|nr:transcription antitermination factor NusB [Parasporobacterium paucivorans]SHI94961.1 NusB antitermination factor [Parasporobacterium paucivorans DSM 15970]